MSVAPAVCKGHRGVAIVSRAAPEDILLSKGGNRGELIAPETASGALFPNRISTNHRRFSCSMHGV